MHSHDLDLIAALADGSLPPEHHESTLALVDTCAECRDEFEAQELIVSVLADIQPAALTDFERARLHQTVGQLTRETTPKGAWLMWAPRIAVAAAAVAFFGTFGLLFFGGQTTSDSDAAAVESPAETEVAADAAADAGAFSQLAPQSNSEESAAAAAEPADETSMGLTERALETTRFARLGELEEDLTEVTEDFLTPYLDDATPLSLVDQRSLECLQTVSEHGPVVLAATAQQRGNALEIYLADAGVFVLDPAECLELIAP